MIEMGRSLVCDRVDRGEVVRAVGELVAVHLSACVMPKRQGQRSPSALNVLPTPSRKRGSVGSRYLRSLGSYSRRC